MNTRKRILRRKPPRKFDAERVEQWRQLRHEKGWSFHKIAKHEKAQGRPVAAMTIWKRLKWQDEFEAYEAQQKAYERRWTELYVQEGLSLENVSKRFFEETGVRIGGRNINLRLKACGVTMRSTVRYGPEDIAHWTKLHNAGKTLMEIHRLTDVALTTLYDAFISCGLILPPRQRPKAQRRLAKPGKSRFPPEQTDYLYIFKFSIGLESWWKIGRTTELPIVKRYAGERISRYIDLSSVKFWNTNYATTMRTETKMKREFNAWKKLGPKWMHGYTECFRMNLNIESLIQAIERELEKRYAYRQPDKSGSETETQP